MKKSRLLNFMLTIGMIATVNKGFASNNNNLPFVPKEIWKEIASYLNTNQKATFSEVCKLFQSIVCKELQEKKIEAEFNKSYQPYCINQPTAPQLLELAKQVAKQGNEDALQLLAFYEQAEGNPSEAIVWMDKLVSISKSSTAQAFVLNLKRIAKGILTDKESVSQVFNGRTGLSELTPEAIEILKKYLS
ncbi:MAG: hypothetical protein IBJ00_06060 [Alphaproteobacteria bacterium]|nr:hypothetical protein [Alphaproteobacteria bacterium]